MSTVRMARLSAVAGGWCSPKARSLDPHPEGQGPVSLDGRSGEREQARVKAHATGAARHVGGVSLVGSTDGLPQKEKLLS
jgi:hypothetical protein